MTKVLQQGEADGLCGLYAVLNFLNTTPWKEKMPTEGLWHLLEACRHFGWLTPQMLTQGFTDFQLKAILDLQFSDYRLEYKTIYLSDIYIQLPGADFDEIARKVIAKNGAMIVQTKSGGHWVLVRGRKGDPAVWDSATGSSDPQPLNKRRLDKELGWGFVVLPFPRMPERVDL